MENSFKPYVFDEFFASEFQESINPFLTEDSKNWSKNLGLKSAFLSAFCLILAFIFSFQITALSHLFLTLVYFLAGLPALIKTFKDFKSFEINIDVLMTLAAFLAVLIGNAMEGALLLVLFELSGNMEENVTFKARGALHKLNELTPTMALVVEEDGSFYQRSVKEIPIGTKLLIKAGEIVPLDGYVIEGISSVNLIHLTGESIPVRKKINDEIPAGARNLEAAITIQVTRVSSESTLSKIIQLITKAHEAKPKLQRWLDKFGRVYASTIIFLTFAFTIILPWILSISFWGNEGSLYRALAFMIAASPCALIIATPTAYLSSISACAKKGILLKGGITLDALASCKTIAFDKTGTLTTGELSVFSLDHLFGEIKDHKLAIAIAAALERHVTHPISLAITKYAKESNIQAKEIKNFQSKAGYGLKGTITLDNQEHLVAIGLNIFIKEMLSKDLKELFDKKIQTITQDNQIIAVLLISSSVFVFKMKDTIRVNVKELINLIAEKKILKPIMLTGDHLLSAQYVANKVGIDEVFANLRPQDKLDLVAFLSKKDGLAMVGDGINDAPALARATIGISLGKIGSSTAVDASDVVLLNDDLFLIDWLIAKANKTIKIVKQNLLLALGVIFLATTPALLGYIPLWLAVILHEGGTVIVGINSLRLLNK
jgi:Zn2+/Cd2+-exporting ATPase